MVFSDSLPAKMSSTIEDSSEDDALIVALIEEGLWLDHVTKFSERGSYPSPEQRVYLCKNVFPSLVPALHALLKRYKKEIEDDNFDEIPQAFPGEPDPVMWLAHYLLRNSAQEKGSKLIKHPFGVINATIIKEAHCAKEIE